MIFEMLEDHQPSAIQNVVCRTILVHKLFWAHESGKIQKLRINLLHHLHASFQSSFTKRGKIFLSKMGAIKEPWVKGCIATMWREVYLTCQHIGKLGKDREREAEFYTLNLWISFKLSKDPRSLFRPWSKINLISSSWEESTISPIWLLL